MLGRRRHFNRSRKHKYLNSFFIYLAQDLLEPDDSIFYLIMSAAMHILLHGLVLWLVKPVNTQLMIGSSDSISDLMAQSIAGKELSLNGRIVVCR